MRENTWHERLSDQPADLAGKSILVVGMGRIGSRTVKRCVAFEMDVYVLDPNISEADIKKAGATKVTDLKAILPKVDFVSVHCPKSPETVEHVQCRDDRPDEARRLPGEHRARRHRQRGGALHGADQRQAARRGPRRARREPPDPSNKLFGLENVIFSPHMAGVTKEANDRMAIAVMENILSVFDGKPNVAHCVNKESYCEFEAPLSSRSAARSSISSSVGKRPVLLRVYLSAPSTVTSNWPDLPGRSSMSVAPSFSRRIPHTEGLRLIASSAAIFDQDFHAPKVGA